MKKIIFTLIFLCILTVGAFGQTLLDVNRYFSCFPIKAGEDVSDNDYVWSSADDDYERFMSLDGYGDIIDTPLEFALLSYYSQPVLNIRPAQADAILPRNNPRLADQKLGAAVFQEIQILRFLGDTAAVNRHEAVLQFITGRGNATRAEIEAFYRNNIRGLIEGVVDREFVGITIPAATVIEIKQVIGNFFVTPTQTNFTMLQREQLIFEHRLKIIEANDALILYSQLLGAEDFRNLTNAINELKRSLRLLTGEDFDPVDKDPSIYRNILNSYMRILRSLNSGLAERVFQ